MSNSSRSRIIAVQTGINRRKFIYTSALAVSAFSLHAKPELKSANDKLNIAIIGSGGRGASNLGDVKSENIVALCDVNENNLNSAAAKYPGAKTFVDFRKLFDHVNDFDAVVVSTTEHTHAFVTMLALKAGKHVYCEKPLTHSVWEARQIVEAAKKAKVATQMGTQIHAGNNYRRVVELIQSGAIGPVREAHVWVSRAWGDGERPKEIVSVPAGLHWDLWLGPAPERPYHPEYIAGSGSPRWYKFWDFGGGTMSDLGAHYNDLAFWALKLDAPRTIEAHTGPASLETAPATMHVTYEYGARGELPPVKHHWYQGNVKPQIWNDGKIPKWDSGHLFIGDKGMLLGDYGKHVLLPENNFKDFQPPTPFIPDSIGHHAEWIHACKTGARTTCNFTYSGALTEANHLGNVAHRLGKKIEWNAKKLKVTNAPEAAPIIRREYRKGWKLA
jgi:predicted dehydrogenase